MPYKENKLRQLGKSSISATDIASQFWCEKQMELNYLYGKKYTEQMRKGRQIHETLQAETFIPLTVEPVTYADYMYKVGYEDYMALKTLDEKGVCRELQIYGSLNGYRIVGKIDELRKEKESTRIIELKTIEANARIAAFDEAKMKLHTVQIMLYKRLLDSIKNREYTLYNFAKSYGIESLKLSDTFLRGLHTIGIKEEFANIGEIYRMVFDAISALPPISEKLELRYIDRFSGKQASSIIINYSEEKINSQLKFALGYWNGDREALPVSEEEKWKCKLCKFYGKECKVWWNGD